MSSEKSGFFDKIASAGKTVRIQTVVTGQNAVRSLTESLAKIPAIKKVPISALIDSAPLTAFKKLLSQIAAGAVHAAECVKNISSSAMQTEGDFLKKTSNDGLKNIQKNFTSFQTHLTAVRGSLKNLWSFFSQGGSAFSILSAGVQGLTASIKTCIALFRDNPMKNAAELAQRNAANLQSSFSQKEKIRRKTDSHIAYLGELAEQNKLSNVEKLEARKKIDALQRVYGDLGIRMDENTGKLSGVDDATEKKLQKDHDARIQEKKSAIRHLQEAREAQVTIRDNAGFSLPLPGQYRLGGGEKIAQAGEKIEALSEEIMAQRQELYELERNNPAKNFRERREAEMLDRQEAEQSTSMSEAVRSAQMTKGSVLTIEENEMVHKLAGLAASFSQMQPNYSAMLPHDRFAARGNSDSGKFSAEIAASCKKQTELLEKMFALWNNAMEK